jgi:hypothetical protein
MDASTGKADPAPEPGPQDQPGGQGAPDEPLE